MRERVKALSGTMVLLRDEPGTRLVVSIPIGAK
jgi:signal transduction histidine kinase